MRFVAPPPSGPAAGRRRCGGPARRSPGASGSPVSRSQNTTVSRWLVIPIAAIRLSAASLRDRRARHRERASPRFRRASCSTRPGALDNAGSVPPRLESRCRWPSCWNSIARVDVVPSSITRIRSDISDMASADCVNEGMPLGSSRMAERDDNTSRAPSGWRHRFRPRSRRTKARIGLQARPAAGGADTDRRGRAREWRCRSRSRRGRSSSSRRRRRW